MGFTEAADSDLTDAEMRARGRHKSAKVLPRYAKRTMEILQTWFLPLLACPGACGNANSISATGTRVFRYTRCQSPFDDWAGLRNRWLDDGGRRKAKTSHRKNRRRFIGFLPAGARPLTTNAARSEID
jgi:hypothetical protein